jgi:hypothetical protein
LAVFAVSNLVGIFVKSFAKLENFIRKKSNVPELQWYEGNVEKYFFKGNWYFRIFYFPHKTFAFSQALPQQNTKTNVATPEPF